MKASFLTSAVLLCPHCTAKLPFLQHMKIQVLLKSAGICFSHFYYCQQKQYHREEQTAIVWTFPNSSCIFCCYLWAFLYSSKGAWELWVRKFSPPLAAYWGWVGKGGDRVGGDTGKERLWQTTVQPLQIQNQTLYNKTQAFLERIFCTWKRYNVELASQNMNNLTHSGLQYF